MPRPQTQPPWEFLLSASRNSLQSYELSRLNHAANLRKEIGALLEQWVEENTCAMLARLLIRQRERPAHASELTPDEESLPRHGHSVSDNFFANRNAEPPVTRARHEVKVIFGEVVRTLPRICRRARR